MLETYDIALIPGDGIGIEVVEAARRVLDKAAAVHGGWRMKYTDFPWSCKYYAAHGKMAPDGFLTTLRDFDSIFLGAVGYPGVPDHVSLWGLLLPIRRTFQQYINLRPVKLLRGISSPLAGKGPAEIDMLVVRENTEGEYSNIGGRLHSGTQHELVIQNTVFTRHGTERVIKYAFNLAETQGRSKVTGATKSNGINYTMPFWDELFKETAGKFDGIRTELIHIDALAAMFVLHPERLQVVVASNLFGDILTDLGAAIAGSIGIAPSANLNPEKEYPSMFEPVHGSAPDIAGQGIANPIGQIWSGAMMLEHLGQEESAAQLMRAVEYVLDDGNVLTPDLGGEATTAQVTEAIVSRIEHEAANS